MPSDLELVDFQPTLGFRAFFFACCLLPLFMIPIHHIQRAIHAFYAEVTERSMQLALRYPDHRIVAEKMVRKSNDELAHFIGILKSTNWSETSQELLQNLCRDAEENSLLLLRELQIEEGKAKTERKAEAN
jgi:hypothetical protein|tara:strand:- start:5728 stop:6120 length:393 start_codon:yes stop_codon:yes gene_type:complete